MLEKKINVIIRIPRKGKEEFFFDKAFRKHEKETGKEWYWLKRSKRKAPLLAFSELHRTNKGVFAELYSPAAGEYHACEFDRGTVKAMEVEQKNFYVDMIKQSYDRFQNKKGLLEKIMPILLIGMFALSIIMIFWGFSNYGISAIVRSVQTVEGAANNVADAWEKVGESMQGAGVVRQVTNVVPPPG